MQSSPKRELPGSRLKRLLRLAGIMPRRDCRCDEIAAEMDAGGCQWCDDHADEIVEQMRAEAWRRHWPVPRRIVRRVLILAIKLECRSQRND